VENESAEKLLPSGRSVVVKLNEGREELEIRAPDGAVEVQIVLTESGPVVRLHGARLELAATETVAVDCKRFEVHTSEATKLESDGELRVKTADDVHINGKFIRLNC
jgi:phage gp45-like